MDQVRKKMTKKKRKKRGLLDSSDFYIDVILLLEDINRPEVSPRWLWRDR